MNSRMRRWTKKLARIVALYDEGHIVVDETIVLTERARRGRGTKSHTWHATDPDAEFWTGKDKDRKKKGDTAATSGTSEPADHKEDKKKGSMPDDAGFGYGITLVKRVHGPYRRRLPLVVVGIHIGKPTGGTGEAVRVCLAAAFRNGVLKRRKGQRIIADYGFTKLHQFWYLAHELHMKVSRDYATNHKAVTELPGEAPQPDGAAIKVPGGYIVNGKITCPGYQPDPKDLLGRLDVAAPLNQPGQASALREHKRRESLLDAHTAPVKIPVSRTDSYDETDILNEPLPTAKELDRSRYRVTVGCPARANKCNCPLYPRDTTEGVHIIEPPSIEPVDMRPAMCRGEGYATFELDITDAKKLQDKAYGSEFWEDLYSLLRNADERFHNMFKSKSGGGIEGSLETVGLARNGITAAVSVAVTNRLLLTSFAQNHLDSDGTPTFSDREAMRRQRAHFFKQP